MKGNCGRRLAKDWGTADYVQRVRTENFVDETGRMCGLTPHQIKVADEFIKDGDPVQAMMRAGQTSYNSALRSSYRLFSKNKVFLAYLDRLVRERGRLESCVQVLEDALQATLVVGGKVTKIPDHKVRMQASSQIRDMAFKIHDRLAEDSRDDPNAAIEHTSLASEPLEVLRWAAEHKRLPTEEEREKIVATN